MLAGHRVDTNLEARPGSPTTPRPSYSIDTTGHGSISGTDPLSTLFLALSGIWLIVQIMNKSYTARET